MDPKDLKRIVVATDFSELSAGAIDTAVAFARASGALVDVVHVAAEMIVPAPPPFDVVTLPIDLAAAMEAASRRLSDEEARVRARGVACESNVLAGNADGAIVAHADKTHADLIVLATHGRGGLAHAFLGSVAEKVVQHAHCPVLSVPHKA